MAWYDEAVFYHIYPLGLTGAPRKNDYGEPVHRLPNLLPWIGHLKKLGFTALYIGPLFQSVGHGYETTDYRLLDSRLGTNEDLKDFVAACHEAGLKVIFDGVFNHTGRDFFAFKDIQAKRENSAYRDWYCNVNFGGNNEYNDGFSYDNWGGYNLLVKLNQRNPAVRDYICDVIRFWVSEFDVDGIRLDAADVLDFEFMKALRRTAEAVDRCLGSGSVEWRKCAGTWGCEWPDGSHYAVFRLPVALRGADGLPLRLEKPVALDVGLVFDVAAVYLNEQRIGLVGRFPDGERVAFTEAAARGLAVVPPEAWSKDGNDCLTLVVYRERGVGGVSGTPGLLLHNPLEDTDLKDIASVNDAFSLLLHSDCFAEAGTLLDKAAPADGAARAWLLSHKAQLSYLQWVDGGEKDEALLDGVLAPVAEILSSLPAEAPKQSAMQAFCRVLRLAEKNAATADAVRRRFPSFDGNCTVLSDDRMTLGDWQMHYGNRFYVLAAMGQVRDWNGPGGREPLEYSVTVPADRDIARYWLPASQRELDDPSALLMHGRYKKGLSEVSEWKTLEKLFPLSIFGL